MEEDGEKSEESDLESGSEEEETEHVYDAVDDDTIRDAITGVEVALSKEKKKRLKTRTVSIIKKPYKNKIQPSKKYEAWIDEKNRYWERNKDVVCEGCGEIEWWPRRPKGHNMEPGSLCRPCQEWVTFNQRTGFIGVVCPITKNVS